MKIVSSSRGLCTARKRMFVLYVIYLCVCFITLLLQLIIPLKTRNLGRKYLTVEEERSLSAYRTRLSIPGSSDSVVCALSAVDNMDAGGQCSTPLIRQTDGTRLVPFLELTRGTFDLIAHPDQLPEEGQQPCAICLTNKRCRALANCMHVVYCTECANNAITGSGNTQACPVCRERSFFLNRQIFAS
jgi:hypothetical protein